MTPVVILTGPRTVGKYQIVAKLAEGPMGLVYKAKDPDSGATVAIKVGSVAVARDRSVILDKGYGPGVSASTVYDIGSIAKSFTADQKAALEKYLKEHPRPQRRRAQ